MLNKDFPAVHFYDQDFVDIYNQTWAWTQDYWETGSKKTGFKDSFFNYPESSVINQFEACMSSFFLVYSNKVYNPEPQLDNFYSKQEANGAIRGMYSLEDGKPILSDDNPEGVMPPLFSWVEYNLYHKIGNKKRVKEIMPYLEAYFDWLESTFRDETGLYKVPLSATMMPSKCREGGTYFVDFNTQMAINALYMSELGDILNDKEISFKYKRQYFGLKTRINQKMWNEDLGTYLDLDADENQIKAKTLATFWPLLAEIPNEVKTEALIAHLKNHDTFGTDHPVPTVAADEPTFSEDGDGYNGSVLAPFTFMVVKGLEKYGAFDLARECSIKHMYFILDALHPEGKKGNIWEAYKARSEGPAKWPSESGLPREMFLPFAGLTTVTLMIENIIGLYISLPRKTVDWIVPTLEIMGIENLSLKRNLITILSNKTKRGWEIRLESEKLYYFTIDILGDKKKTLPIPSGKCSMLVDKL